MGMAWIQATGPTPRSHFLAGITDWPSAYKVESAAILTVLLTVPENGKVAIHTDNSACITMMEKILYKDPRFTHKRWIKEKNWSLWLRISKIIQAKTLSIKMYKVKAHSGNEQNEWVDQLAKQAREEPAIIWESCQSSLISTEIKWQGHNVDISIRDFIKNLNNKDEAVKWTQQNRILEKWNKQTEQHTNYSWPTV